MKSCISMKKVRTIGIVFTIQLYLMSCATTSSKISFQEVTPKDKDSAIIYVYRLPSMVGAAVKWVVRLDNRAVANLNQNAYIVLQTSPGPHTIAIGDSPVSLSILTGGGLIPGMIDVAGDMLDNKSREDGTFSAATDAVYFIRSKGFNVSIVTREEAMKEIVNMTYDMGM